MTDKTKNDTLAKSTLAKSPEDPVTGQVKPQGGPLERPGTEAAERAETTGGDHPPEPPGDGPGRSGERAAAYRENDA